MNRCGITHVIFWICVLCPLLRAEKSETLFQNVKSKIDAFAGKGADGEIHELARIEATLGSSLANDEYVQLYLRMLVILEARIDPDFNFDEEAKYPMHAEPPKGYDSGVSPDSVRDESEKAAYLRRIQEHKTRTTRFLNQTAALKLKDRIISNLVMIGRSEKTITDSPVKKAALAAISESSLPSVLKTRLNEAFGTSTTEQNRADKK